MRWCGRVEESFDAIPGFIEYYEKELQSGKTSLRTEGKSIDNVCSRLPGMVEHRYTQLQDIESVLEYLNIKLSKTKSKYFKKYLEHYNRTLSARDCEKYIDGEDEIYNMKVLINRVALVRNEYLGLMKGLDQLSFMLGHITKLRCAGLDDTNL